MFKNSQWQRYVKNNINFTVQERAMMMTLTTNFLKAFDMKNQRLHPN